MKGNGSLTPEYGGAVRIINFFHSFFRYLPPEKYFQDHPDWCSEIEGQRKHEHPQLCLTNEQIPQAAQDHQAARQCPDPSLRH
jgi:hypothetical protein